MRIAPLELKQLVSKVFAAAGCRAPENERVAHYLVESNLVGHDSHGVIRVPTYVGFLAEGKVLANQTLKVVLETDVLAVVDGQFGLGQTMGEAAVRLGVDKAARNGVSCIALRNCGHLGRIGDWPTLAARSNQISLHFVNTSGAGLLMAPFGGINRRLSANPIAIGVPVQGSWPMIMDISASSVAEGKIRVAFNKGANVPEGCLIDSTGKPTVDPKVFYGDPPGAILPFGAHKGYGLGMMAEVLAGALTEGGCTAPGVKRLSNGMFSIFLELGFFTTHEKFFAELARFIEFVKSSAPAAPGGEILIPGEIEERNRAARTRDGIELDATTWGQITATCKSLGVGVPQTGAA